MRGIHIFMISVGAFAALCGLLIAILRVRTILWGRSAEGVVVDVEEGSRTQTGTRITTMKFPVVQFEHEGRKVRFRSSLGQAAAMRTGTRVAVRYLASDPESSAEIDAPANLWTFSLLTLLVAIVFIGLALWDAGYLSG
jgi:hypothetical protein